MARKKMRKFSEGGEAARSAKINKRYDRKVADIDSDYKKALAKGKNADVAKAKYEQRMADAADDRAKWTGGDRTSTRAAERAAEKNLSMTRKYGPRSSDTQVAKAEESLTSKAPLSSVDTSSLNKPKTTSFKEAFRAAREKGVKTFTWDGKPGVTFTTQLAGAAPKRTGAGKAGTGARKAPVATAKADVKSDVKTTPRPELKVPASLSLAGKGKTYAQPASSVVKAPASLSLANKGKNAPAEPTLAQKRAARLEEWRKAAEAPGASTYVKDRYRYGKETGMVGNFKKGGMVKKFNKGGSTGEDKRRSVLGSDKDIIGRGNRTPYEPIPKTGPDKPKSKPLGRAGKAGFKSGGSVMKKGIDGVAKKGKTKGMMPKMACGGKMKGYAKGGSIDGIAVKGKTRCKGAK